MKNKGFSLVELIVVIAIMAILVGVAVPVYTSYIEKSQKAADIQLVDEIKHAMEIANAGQTLTESAYVILSSSGATVYNPNGALANHQGKTQLEKVLQGTFGDDWATDLAVKYSGWKAVAPNTYAGTSFYGKEDSLLTEVDRLTGALGEAVVGGISLGGFDPTKYGVDAKDPTAVGNAALLYVSDRTVGNELLIQETFSKNLGNDNFIGAVYDELSGTVGQAAALAAIYAYAEGFAQYCDTENGNTKATEAFHEKAKFNNVTKPSDAFGQVQEAFGALAVAGGDANITAYMQAGGPGMKDLAGYLSIMGTVNDNQDMVVGNLSDPDCYLDGTVEKMLNGYASMGNLGISTQNGQVAIAFVVEDGETNIYILPLNLEK